MSACPQEKYCASWFMDQWCTPPFYTKIGGGVAKKPAAAAFGGVAPTSTSKLETPLSEKWKRKQQLIQVQKACRDRCRLEKAGYVRKVGLRARRSKTRTTTDSQPEIFRRLRTPQAFQIWKFWWNISCICARRYCAQFFNFYQIFPKKPFTPNHAVHFFRRRRRGKKTGVGGVRRRRASLMNWINELKPNKNNKKTNKTNKLK